MTVVCLQRPAAARLVAALSLAVALPVPAIAAEDPPPARHDRRKAQVIAPVKPGPPIAIRAARRRTHAEGTVTVLSVSAGRAYLDAGAQDGLAVGKRVTFQRRGRPSGTCTLDAVVEHSASCSGPGLRAGDTSLLAPRAAPAPTQPPEPLPPVLPASETSRRRAALEAAPVAKVEYVAPARDEAIPGLQRVQASLVHASYLSSGVAALHDERIEARVLGAEVFPGWRLFLDASGVYRGSSAASERFRPGDSAYLEVREFELTSREPDRNLVVALGRVLPWNAPGSTAVDGAQVGWRGSGGEIGVFGGTVPDVLTTGLTTSRQTGGLYGAVERASDTALLHGEGRVEIVKSPELGTRIEAEALAHAWLWRTIDVSGQARLGFAGDRIAPASIDMARIDLSARLGEPLWLTGSYRYFGLLFPDEAAPALFPGPARNADVTASWDVSRLVTVRFTGGYANDLVSGLERGYAGPEIAFPRLFGWRGGVAAGWLEERGWAGGRSIWLQGQGEGFWGVRLLLRGSLFMDTRPAPLQDESTVGIVASASKDLASWLRFRLSGLGRMDLSSVSSAQTFGGISFLAALDGMY